MAWVHRNYVDCWWIITHMTQRKFLSAWPYIFLPRMWEITQRKRTRSWPALSIFLQGEDFLVNWQIWIFRQFIVTYMLKSVSFALLLIFWTNENQQWHTNVADHILDTFQVVLQWESSYLWQENPHLCEPRSDACLQIESCRLWVSQVFGDSFRTRSGELGKYFEH